MNVLSDLLHSPCKVSYLKFLPRTLTSSIAVETRLHEKMTKRMKTDAHSHITVDRFFCDAVADFIETQEKEPGQGVHLNHIQSQASGHPEIPFGAGSQKK